MATKTMSSGTGAPKVTKLLTFDGTQEGWFYWSDKFLAHAEEKEYEDLLTGKVVAPDASKQLDPTVDAAELKLRELNRSAFKDLLLCVSTKTSEGKVAYCAVKACKSNKLPKGDAALAWKTLKERYEGKSVPNVISLEEAYGNCKLKGKTHPETWITQMQEMRNRLQGMQVSINDQNFMRHLMTRLPKGYQMQKEFLMDAMEKGTLTVQMIRQRLTRRYEEMYGTGHDPLKEGVKEDSIEETALMGYKGKCNECGEYGHKARDCPNKKNDDDGDKKKKSGYPFKGVCFVCGKKGHKAYECRHRKGVSERATPAAIVEKEEASVDSDESSDDGYEFVLVTQDGKASNENEKDIWLADSGASCHMSNCLEGFVELRKVSDAIVIGDGKHLDSKGIGTWKGTAVHKDGSKLRITLEDVYYVPNLCGNLFGLNRSLEKGWTLGNDGHTVGERY